MNLINLIALMQPLRIIKCLKIHLQATFVFFLCHLCSTNLFLKYWFNFIGNLFLFYFLFSSFNRNLKQLINIYFWQKMT